jgi:type III pantothenate kinase
MILLLDIGNTHTHCGLAGAGKIRRHRDLPTGIWFQKQALKLVRDFVGGTQLQGVCFCSVVPRATERVRRLWRDAWPLPFVELTHRTVTGLGIDYPKPETIGPDRLANAVAARHRYGAPAVVVDFGTAVTFDVVDRRGHYAGGIIAPGLEVMTSYLHERTALLPSVRLADTRAAVGKSTEEAMRIGAVHGYRGLIKELVGRIKREFHCRRLPVVATGGYARLVADQLPEITEVDPMLTLEGLRLVWQAQSGNRVKKNRRVR